jgi:glucose-6-phosphate 1-dehydrogenase
MSHQDRVIYFFGATGDLAGHKIWPAIANLFVRQESFRVVAFGGKQAQSDDSFYDWLKNTLKDHPVQTEQWLEQVEFHSVDLLDPALELPIQLDAADIHIFYVALSTHIYRPLLERLRTFLPHPKCRIVLEKPIGTQLDDALDIQAHLRQLFSEDQIYRIDHYLGKWTVQNVLALRFANSIFEHQWNQKYIDHIQISIAETLGIENRAVFYDNIGALRDMVQNHLVQLLCLIAMEPPASLNPEAIRDERVKVLRALKPLVNHNVVRGQYLAGHIKGEAVPGYLESIPKGKSSNTETFIALKAEINNWRWAGVPFYLRTGKRLATKCCEIVVQFKSVPHPIFKNQAAFGSHNRLIFRLQPEESIKIEIFEQTNDNRRSVRPIQLSLDAPNFRGPNPDAYERLLLDALKGDPTLFVREDEWSEAWRWVDPVLREWGESEAPPYAYQAGTWGPTESINLLARERRTWEDPNA